MNSFFLVYIACVVVSGTLEMPHCRSAAVRAARHARACERGYLRTLRPGSAYVQVPLALKDRVREQARALELHARCNEINGFPHHFTGAAICAARPSLSDVEFKNAQALNRRAASARHEWAAPVLPIKRVRWADMQDDLDPWVVGGGPW